MSNMPGHVEKSFAQQARACRELGSPFTAGLCELLIDGLDASTRFGARILDWPESAAADALALRAAGALNWLARSGRARELAALYPPLEARPETLWEAIAAAIAKHDDALYEFLDSPPQTNEVRRSSALLGVGLILSERFGMRLALNEIGASAGLNLFFDRYLYDLGEEREWGPSSAGVEIASEWRGHLPPLEAPLEIAERAGCDRNPLDPRKTEETERLLAYIWADQHQRVERTSAALAAAASMPARIDRADAAAWVEEKLAEPARQGVVRVFFHTVVWQYLPDATKERVARALGEAGAAATSETPLVWMSMEAEGEATTLRMTAWPGGKAETLGRADYHGRWVEWAERD